MKTEVLFDRAARQSGSVLVSCYRNKHGDKEGVFRKDGVEVKYSGSIYHKSVNKSAQEILTLFAEK